MKTICTLILALLSATGSAFCQSMATSVAYDKVVMPGLMLNLPYDESVSEDFIVAALKKTGYNAETKGKLFWKQNKVNGYYIFKDVRLKGASKQVDLYFKVDRKGKKSNDESTIYMLTATAGEQFVSESSNENTYNAAKNFLNTFVDEAAAYKLGLDIKEQEEEVQDAEKKLDKLNDNTKDIAKHIEQLQKDLKKNNDDVTDQQKKVETEKKKLDKLKDQKS
jgi:hypothetical protein